MIIYGIEIFNFKLNLFKININANFFEIIIINLIFNLKCFRIITKYFKCDIQYCLKAETICLKYSEVISLGKLVISKFFDRISKSLKWIFAGIFPLPNLVLKVLFF